MKRKLLGLALAVFMTACSSTTGGVGLASKAGQGDEGLG